MKFFRLKHGMHIAAEANRTTQNAIVRSCRKSGKTYEDFNILFTYPTSNAVKMPAHPVEGTGFAALPHGPLRRLNRRHSKILSQSSFIPYEIFALLTLIRSDRTTSGKPEQRQNLYLNFNAWPFAR